MNPQEAYMLRIAALDNLTPIQEAYRDALNDTFHAHSLWIQHGTDDMYTDWVCKFSTTDGAWLALSTEEQNTFRV